MLILSRKKDESIIIGDQIEIRVIGIDEGRVKLGIEAPGNVKVFRKEIYDAIIQENREASKAKISMDELREAGRILNKG